MEQLTTGKIIGITLVIAASAYFYFMVPEPPCVGGPQKCDPYYDRR